MKVKLEKWQQPVMCRKCCTMIWSDRSGEFVSCECGAIYVDQTPHYARYGGDPGDFVLLDWGDSDADVSVEV